MERAHRGKLSWPAVLLIMVVVCALSYLIALGISKSGVGSLGSYKTVNLASNQGIQTVSDGFVYYDGTSLGFVDAKGTIKWSYMIGTDCGFSASDAGVAAWNGSTLTLIDTHEGTTTYSGAMEGDILSAYVGSKYSAVVLKPEHDSTIILMDSGGKKLTPYIEPDEQTVVDYGFFSSDSLFWVLTLDAKGTVPTTTISTYKPGKTHVGSISNTDQVLYQVLFQSSQIVCVGETYMKTYDYTGTENASQRKLVYGWYLASADETSDNPLMAFAANAQYDGSSTVQDVRLIRSGVDEIVRFPFGCSKLYVKGDRVYGFSTSGYVMETQVGQKKAHAYALPVNVETVYGVLGGNVAVIGYGNQVYLVTLP